MLAGIHAVRRTPLEALPDLSDVQVIVQADYSEQAPRIVEDQVTYPIAAEMLKVPGERVVRGYSFFGVSFVYIIFEDGTDLYWARSRVLEYLNGLQGRLPAGVQPVLGPDATGVGWGFEYALVDRTGKHDLSQLRTLNDWYVQYWLRSIRGVAEVAPVGGYVKQYQIEVDPNALLSYNLPLDQVLVCYHDDADGCECRKPRPGLLLRAAEQHGINLAHSYMVGDRWKDIEAGARAGCKTILIDYAYSEPVTSQPDHIVNSLPLAVDWILQQSRSAGDIS